MSYTSPVRYWRQNEAVQNFGDYLADFLQRELFYPVSGDFSPTYVTGSAIADFMISDTLEQASPEGADFVTYWGCGVRDDGGLQETSAARARILSVRGPRSASTLKFGSLLPQGDPGLLLPSLYQPKEFERTKGKTLCIPHFWDERSDAELLAISGCEVLVRPNVSVGDHDFKSMVDAIATADFVLSASLHGAIVAAAYGKPFGFWDNGKIDLPIKWIDFAESIGVEARFHKTLKSAQSDYAKALATRIRMPSLIPLLAVCPFPLRPTALLKVVETEIGLARPQQQSEALAGAIKEFGKRREHVDQIFMLLEDRLGQLRDANLALTARENLRETIEADLVKVRSEANALRLELDAERSEAVQRRTTLTTAARFMSRLAGADVQPDLGALLDAATDALLTQSSLRADLTVAKRARDEAQQAGLDLRRELQTELRTLRADLTAAESARDEAQQAGREFQTELTTLRSALAVAELASAEARQDLEQAQAHQRAQQEELAASAIRLEQAAQQELRNQLDNATRRAEDAARESDLVRLSLERADLANALSLARAELAHDEVIINALASATASLNDELTGAWAQLDHALAEREECALSHGPTPAAEPLIAATPLTLPIKSQRLLVRNVFARARRELHRLPAVRKWTASEQEAARTSAIKHLMRDLRVERAEQPVISIIIPNYGDPQMALRCLRSLCDCPSETSTEVLLWEDASGDPDIDLLSNIPGLIYYRNKKNLGFIGNCNAAAAAAKGEYIVFLNSDTVVLPGWLDRLLDVTRERSDAGIVGSKLVFPDGVLQEAGGIIWEDGSAWNFGRGDAADRPIYNYLREVDYVSGACLLISRLLFNQIGGFDDHFKPAYCEDSDLAFKVRSKGKKVYYQPLSVVEHHEGGSHGSDLSTGVKAYQVVNSAKLYERWKDSIQRDSFANAEHLFLAKDRGRARRSVLVIDHYVPKPDRDAGSKTMMQFLTCLVDNGWLVKFWPENLHDDEIYTLPLRRMGIEVFTGPEYYPFEDWLAAHGDYFDVILASRPHITRPILDAIRTNSRAGLVYYGHDIHALRMEANRALNENAVSEDEIEAMREQEEQIWRRSDVVLYPSDNETEHVHSRVPSTDARTVAPYFYDRFEHAAATTLDQRKGLLFVAGFGHPPNEDAAVWLVNEIMPRVWISAPELKLALVGSYPTAAVQALASERVEVTGWVDEATLQDWYRNARVAVVPLRFGAGIKSKVVEAMRAGLPLVTTDTGVQGLMGAHACVSVCDSSEAFAAAVLQLAADDSLWRERSQDSASYVEQRFSREVMARQLDEALCAAAAKGSRQSA